MVGTRAMTSDPVLDRNSGDLSLIIIYHMNIINIVFLIFCSFFIVPLTPDYDVHLPGISRVFMPHTIKLVMIVKFDELTPNSPTGGEYGFAELSSSRFFGINPFLLSNNYLRIFVRLNSLVHHRAFCISSESTSISHNSFLNSNYDLSDKSEEIPYFFEFYEAHKSCDCFNNHSFITVPFYSKSHFHIAYFKKYLASIYHIHHSKIRLVYKGINLSNARTFSYYNISDNSTLTMVLAVQGGGTSEDEDSNLGDGNASGDARIPTAIGVADVANEMDFDSNTQAFTELCEEVNSLKESQEEFKNILLLLKEENKLIRQELAKMNENHVTIRSKNHSHSSLLPSNSTLNTIGGPTISGLSGDSFSHSPSSISPINTTSTSTSSHSFKQAPMSHLSLVRNEKGKINTNIMNVSDKPIKKITPHGVSPYDGKTDFEEWYKVFNSHMNLSNAPLNVRVISLFNLLTPSIQKTILETDPALVQDYENLVQYLNGAFTQTPISEVRLMKMIYEQAQKPGEPVTVYTSRLIGMLKKLKETTLSDKTVTEVFVEGLLPDILKYVSQQSTDKTNFTEAQHLAQKAESILALAKERELLLNSTDTSSSSSSKNNNNNDKDKNDKNDKNNKNNNDKDKKDKNKKCTTCGRPTLFGRELCVSCFKKNNINHKSSSSSSTSSTPSTSSNPTSHSSTPDKTNAQPSSLSSSSSTPDFINNRVKYLKIDNNNNNPLHWDYDKLEQEKRCLFCAQPQHQPLCSFPYYTPPEIRCLKSKNINPPTRTRRPKGDSISP